MSIDYLSIVLNSFFNGLGSGVGLGLGAYFVTKILINNLEAVKRFWRGEKTNENKINGNDGKNIP